MEEATDEFPDSMLVRIMSKWTVRGFPWYGER